MPNFDAFKEFQWPVYLIILVKMNTLEAYDFTKHEHEQKSHAMKDLWHHSQNSEVYFTAVVQIFTRLSILTRDFVYMRSRAISADSNLARRQATVNL